MKNGRRTEVLRMFARVTHCLGVHTSIHSQSSCFGMISVVWIARSMRQHNRWLDTAKLLDQLVHQLISGPKRIIAHIEEPNLRTEYFSCAFSFHSPSLLNSLERHTGDTP